jgi:hypothetical protein
MILSENRVSTLGSSPRACFSGSCYSRALFGHEHQVTVVQERCAQAIVKGESLLVLLPNFKADRICSKDGGAALDRAEKRTSDARFLSLRRYGKIGDPKGALPGMGFEVTAKQNKADYLSVIFGNKALTPRRSREQSIDYWSCIGAWVRIGDGISQLPCKGEHGAHVRHRRLANV